ncbi:hypothetical protein [Streptomyces erythrochromogenes]|uniref:hypothetical protein n=1 Tax=Streptomyces erythrochromogenes TaxID=285574 RepID=UPI003430DCBF
MLTALNALELGPEWADDAHPVPYAAPDPVPAARRAADALAAEGKHVHLVSNHQVECLNHRNCVPLPGI